MRIYLDTFALAKAYISEAGSEAVRNAIGLASRTYISSLNLTEMRCLLARRTRAGDFTAEVENLLWSAFQSDVRDEVFELVSVESGAYAQAAALIDRVAPIPLRTLDALHLNIAERLNPDRFFTTDKQLAKAALTIGLNVDTLLTRT